MSNEPSGYQEFDDNDELTAYDVFIVPQDDGTFEAHIKRVSDGREWACGGYETETQASAGAMHFFQLYLMDGES